MEQNPTLTLSPIIIREDQDDVIKESILINADIHGSQKIIGR